MKSAIDFLKEKGIIKEGYSSWRCVFQDGQEFIINELFEEFASQFREPSTQEGEEKSIRDWGGEEIKLRSRIQVLEEALKQIRHKTYSRDTDDSILYEIDSVLTEAGFPYQSED